MEEEKEKRFYWLRLKEDFFQDEAIEWLEEQENGPAYTLFYLKLCLKSLKTDGILIRNVGELLIPYNAEKLAEMTRFPIDTVVIALELLKKIGLVKVVDGGAMFIPQINQLTGSEAANDNALRQKRFRERKKVEKIAQKAQESLDSVTNSNADSNADSNDSNVTQSVTPTLRNSNESIEIRDKRIEYKEKKIIKRKEIIRNRYGSYQNVFLSDEELAKFQSEFDDWERFIEELSGWLAENGKTKKDYLAALRNWGKRDYNGHNQLRRLSKGASSQVVTEPLDELII